MRSFRQARLSQSICKLCWMFWLPVRAQYILENARNSQRRINLQQPSRQSLRFLISPSKRTTCSGDTQCDVAIRLLSLCHLCPCQCFIMAAREEMSMRHPFLHKPDVRSMGLRRKAREKRSMARSGSPSQRLT